MCNYAVNSITFSSRNSKLLKELHKKVLACYDAMSDGKNLVKDLLKAHGYIVPFRVNSTDHVSACDEFITKKSQVYFFRCETTTAWEDNMAPIIILLSEKYHDEIHISFCSEEPGNDIYLVKDETGVFYPDRFKVDWCLDDNYETEYFTTFLDMYHYLKEYFPKAAFCYHDSIEDIKSAIDQMYGDTDDEYFVNINVFRDYYNAEAEYIVSREAA